MKCDELKQVEYPTEWGLYYDKSEVDAAIAELKQKLMPCLNGDCILTCEVVEKYGKEKAEFKQKLDKAIAERDGNQVCIDALKQKLENVQASMYADVVDAGMDNRRLRRALYNLRACYADMMQKRYIECKTDGWVHRVNKWIEVERRCTKKAEEYK